MDYILREIVKNTDTGFNDDLLRAADYILELERRLAEAEAELNRLRCELAETVCPDCGPVSVGPDIFDKDVPISGICPKCGDRLYFAERGSDD